jgi:hypothetical protein
MYIMFGKDQAEETKKQAEEVKKQAEELFKEEEQGRLEEIALLEKKIREHVTNT